MLLLVFVKNTTKNSQKVEPTGWKIYNKEFIKAKFNPRQINKTSTIYIPQF